MPKDSLEKAQTNMSEINKYIYILRIRKGNNLYRLLLQFDNPINFMLILYKLIAIAIVM